MKRLGVSADHRRGVIFPRGVPKGDLHLDTFVGKANPLPPGEARVRAIKSAYPLSRMQKLGVLPLRAAFYRVIVSTFAAFLLIRPLTSFADELDQQLERNMRVYSQSQTMVTSSNRGRSTEQNSSQAEMVVYDPNGQPQSRQRVALGALPPPPQPGDKPLSDYPRTKPAEKSKYEIDYSFTGGYREDSLNWNIAAPLGKPYFGHPNVLSELQWKNITSAQLNAKTEVTSPDGWHVQANVGYGIITGGTQQDSDYDGDFKTREFSRSNNSADSGHMLDASIGGGYRFAQKDENGRVLYSATPLVGYAYNEQYLTATNLIQTIARPSRSWCDPVYNPSCTPPSLGPYYGLDSRYTTEWYGPWLGFKSTASPLDWMDIFGQFEYHWVDYYGRANWNLRPDFQHPLSFKHSSTGDGVMTSAGMRFWLDPHWAVELNGNYTSMITDPGQDTTYFSNGSVGTTRLNRANWNSWGANAGVRYRY